jgi:hypothetical protein
MHTKHLVLLAVAAGLLASRVPALAQPLEVVDATGSKVGSDVISVQEQGPSVAFNLDGRVFALVVTQNGFDGSSLLLFASPDCFGTGTPFLLDNSLFFPSGAVDPAILPPVAIAPPGSTVYLPVPGSPSQSLAVSTLLFADGTCRALPEPATVQAFPAQALGDLSTQFVPPFRVQIVPLPAVPSVLVR